MGDNRHDKSKMENVFSNKSSWIKSPEYNNPFEFEAEESPNKSTNQSDMEDYEACFDLRNNAFDDSNYISDSSGMGINRQEGANSPAMSNFSFEHQNHHKPIPQISRFATPNSNVFEVPKHDNIRSRKPHEVNVFGLDDLQENHSTDNFANKNLAYSLADVGTSRDDLKLDRLGTIMKRNRWGTQRHKSGKPKKPTRTKTLKWKGNEEHAKRKVSIRRRISHSEKHHDEVPDMPKNEDTRNRAYELRSVFFNLPLPQEFLNEDNEPITLFARNKIRTTKYTPLTFLPKNLFTQFRNVANVYFLILIVLGFFDLFGVSNPGLAAVPLIVIVLLTALKDAIEDSRRGSMDQELNNTITHKLMGIPNGNCLDDDVSLWRKFKKLNTRGVNAFGKFLTGTFNKEARRASKMEKLRKQKKIDDDVVEQRKSFESFETQAYQGKNIPMEDLTSTRSSNTYINSENDPANPFKGPSVVNRSIKATGISSFQKCFWKDVKVGDIVRIHNNDELPADIAILSTSDSDGACYVETKNLDGETNLKVRQSLKCSADLRHSSDCEKSKFWVESEGPHANLYSYQGVCKYLNQENELQSEPININNMLLRGCSLRNTKWAIGVVVFTGDDTKIMLNSGVTPTKISRISRELNFSVIMNFVLLFILCLAAGLVNGIYYNYSLSSRHSYEDGAIASTPFLNGLVTFFVAVILYQSLVPISLYISIEIIKTAQAFFIYSDVQMYYDKLDYPCTPKAWNISDDLGQIEYIFSDKTGTLTQNVMEFKKCTINGISYGKAYTEALAGLRKRQGIDVEAEGEQMRGEIVDDKRVMFQELQSLAKNSQFYENEVTFISSEFVKDLSGAKGEAQKSANEHFMLALALCHSVLAEDDKKQPGKILLKAQSPDESALVGTARDMGFSFIERTKKGVILEVQGVEKEYQLLNSLEFNSTRKRMSAIIKIPPSSPGGEPQALLICKGADSIIYSRLRKDSDEKLLEKTALHLEQYATEGLRTLCIAHRTISWKDYEAWSSKHHAAGISVENRDEKLEEVAELIERDLTLLGGTAIEDRLQVGVSDSIEILSKAGIKLWVLTGDKVETAINIGFSCNLLNNDMDLLVVKAAGEDAEKLSGEKAPKSIVTSLISKYLGERFNMTGSDEEITQAKKDHKPPTGNFGLVIDGDALKIALQEDLQLKFLLLCKSCKAVLCCRVSPAQKAAVVSLVKETLDVMTLSIGDGSNDVAMIQAADVGVGIAGEEGRQAVMSSDYAIGQFRYLTRLILVHGRWSYKRLAEMIPCFFYKNVIFTLALFWFGIYSNFDGAYLFEYTYLMFYNLAFTSLPVIFMGIFDQDVSDVVSLLVPQLYTSGILRSEWTNTKFLVYMSDALYQSIICFFFPYLVFYRTGFVTENGLTVQHRYWIGCYVATIAVVACDIYVLMHQYRWDWLSVLIFTLSILVVFGWTGIWSSATSSGEFYKAAAQIYGTLTFWTCFFVGVLVCLLPRFTYDSLKRLYSPKDIDIVRECVARGDFDRYSIDYDPTDPEKKAVGKLTSTDSENPPALLEENKYANAVIPENVLEAEPEQRQSFNPSRRSYMMRTSLDRTRAEMFESNELQPTISFGGRTSLEIPGINVANQLIATRSRTSNN